MAHRRHAWLAIVVLGVLAVGAARAAERCAMSCRNEVAACKRTECAATKGDARRACLERCRGRLGCPTRLRTVAWVVTRCRTRGDRIVASQELRIRRGDCDPVTVMRLEAPGELTDPAGLCRILADNRQGVGSVLAGAFQRLGVAPDGSGVAFEVTNQFMLTEPTPLAEEQQGFFYVRADGTELRRVGPPSRDPTYRVGLTPAGELTASFVSYLAFDPAGRHIVYTDIGAAPDGTSRPQVFTLDVVTGLRTQVTRLPPVVPTNSLSRLVSYPLYLDDRTIGFHGASIADAHGVPGQVYSTLYTVRTDGTHLRRVSPIGPLPDTVVGDVVTPIFEVPSATPQFITLRLRAAPTNPDPSYPDALVREVFRVNGAQVLQLTAFGRYDTLHISTFGNPYGARFNDLRGAPRALFRASADPLGQNPFNNCQMFSVDPLGGRLHQITRFDEGVPSVLGCNFHATAGCSFADHIYHDRGTRSLLFYSDCNPLGTNANGSELFTMRDDGSQLRQITRSAGIRALDGGDVDVEIIGQYATSFASPLRTRTRR